MKKKLWIVTANSGSVQIFEVKGNGKSIKKVKTLAYAEGRAHPGDINTDKQGRGHAGKGTATHSRERAVDPHRHQEKVWAKEIAGILAKEQENSAFDELAIAAPPEFLGELRNALSSHKAVEKAVIKELPKDFPDSLSDSQVTDHLRKSFDLWNQ